MRKHKAVERQLVNSLVLVGFEHFELLEHVVLLIDQGVLLIDQFFLGISCLVHRIQHDIIIMDQDLIVDCNLLFLGENNLPGSAESNSFQN
jgi:hypothetical protein